MGFGPAPRPAIERLAVSEGERLRAIRLRALRDSPDAFATTFEGAAAWPLATWERQLERIATFVAVQAGTDIGLARGARHERLDDTGFLISLWVAPEARRQSVGSSLVAAVVGWAGSLGLARLLLDVGESNASALALYERAGFQRNGVRGSLPPPREHLHEVQMALTL